MTTRIVVIGNGGFAINCLKVMKGYDDIVVPLVVTDPTARAMHGLLSRFCAGLNLPVIEATDINADTLVRQISSTSPDFLFSVYNMRIIKRGLLAVPRAGIVNFHNGPLPRYRGVNVYSWAIINGETDYGVSWHFVDEGVDTGDIVGVKMFPLTKSETLNTLIAKGFRAGVELLDEILPGMIAGKPARLKQDESVATHYSRRDLPNGGRISFEWTFERIERFVRGLDFRPLENTFVYPTASFHGACFYPQTLQFINDTRTKTPGSIVSVDERFIAIQCVDAVIGLSHILDARYDPVTPIELQKRLRFGTGGKLD